MEMVVKITGNGFAGVLGSDVGVGIRHLWVAEFVILDETFVIPSREPTLSRKSYSFWLYWLPIVECRVGSNETTCLGSPVGTRTEVYRTHINARDYILI